MEVRDIDYREVVISSINIALLDLMNEAQKARLMDAICARLRGKEPQGIDEATRIVFESIARDNEKVCPITKSSQTLQLDTEDQERIKEKVCAKAHTKEKKERMVDSLMADDRVAAAFDEFVKMRKLIKKPLTDLAMKRALSKLHKLSDDDPEKAVAILNKSVDHCWQDLYALKDEAVPAAQTTTKTQAVCGQRSERVQRAYGFGTERNDVDYNALAWQRIREAWAEDEEDDECNRH